MSKNKQLSNSFSTGGGGGHFEAHVQASFVSLMITGGFAPCLPCWPIKEVKLQGKIDGYDTDDLIVFVEKTDSKEMRKMLGQVKHSIAITQGDKIFSEVIQSAWNDFNNRRVFSKNKDVIVLITGPLSATDFHNVQWLLSQAKHTKNVDEFLRYVEQSNFSPSKSIEKLNVFRYHLKLANNNNEISKDELYSFLNHFHLLGYDLGKEVGVALSLLYSHIAQYVQQNTQWIWSRIVDIVQTWNHDAGTITLEKLPEDIRDAFKQPNIVYIPAELTIFQQESNKTDLKLHRHASSIALINLVGAWNEQNTSDIDILKSITTESYSTLVPKVREILQLLNSPISLHNGLWRIIDRTTLWELLGSWIFDENLDILHKYAVVVLTEKDPSFEIPIQERYAANILGKVQSYSPDLRKGLAESLALLGNNSGVLTNCSHYKAEATAVLSIREIFTNADWVLWGSLNELLPILAEAAPEEFLRSVENTLCLEICPFDKLFSQEGDGLTGKNYLTGLLWALEGLAWEEKYLVRVCMILGELDSHDPGGKWSNRPCNSLSTILLPWYPQTIASIEKRKVAVQTLRKEWPNIAWKLIVSLLPTQNQTSMGSHKPTWLKTIPVDWDGSVTYSEYWEQVSFYAEIAVSMASEETSFLMELIDHFDDLPKSSFDQLLEVLSSEKILRLQENERIPIWDRMIKLISTHRCYSDAEWALNNNLISAIEVVANKLEPKNPFNLYQHLFSENDSDNYEINDEWEDQQKKLEIKRKNGIEDILNQHGIDGLIKFAEVVESPDKVGRSLGCFANNEIDSLIIPTYLGIGENDNLTNFISGYIWSRHSINDWKWVDELDKTGWSAEQIIQLLSYLPFDYKAWVRVAEWVGGSESGYWLKINANPYQTESNLPFAIDKLIEYGRPYAAIKCLNVLLHKKQNIDIEQCVNALINALHSSEPSYTMNVYHILELIKLLQNTPEVNTNDLFRVEWAYLPLLNHHNRANPKLLHTRLANDPEFFCEVIRLIYRSKKSDNNTILTDEGKRRIATNSWQLLQEWKTLPGLQEDGSFDNTFFLSWLKHVKEICNESGHLEVALINIGKVLIHSPSDMSGLWINDTIARVLNAKDADDMRSGFSTGIFNSRGVHWVDPTGKQEFELAEQYQEKANVIENAGYHRLAFTLRNLSESFTREGKRNVIDSNNNKEEDN